MAAPNTRISRAHIRGSWSLVCLFPGLALLATLLWACEMETTAPEDRRIGTEGGTATLEKGAVTLLVPDGALLESVWFTALPTNTAPTAPLLIPGTTWEVGPPGLTFSRPVSLTIAYDPADLPPEVGEDELGLFQAVGGSWVFLDYASADPAAHTVTGGVLSLGRFGVLGLALTGLELSPASDTLAPGTTLRLEAAPLGEDGRTLKARPVAWSTSDPATATVDSTGVVTGVREGTTTITARSGGFSAAATILTREPVTSVEVSPNTGMMRVGQTLQLVGTARSGAGGALEGRRWSWVSSEPTVAAVDSTGLVRAVSLGSATISATVEGATGAATLSVHGDLAVTTGYVAGGVVGIPYEQVLAASGGNGTYVWSLVSGTLPGGLALDPASGSITGIPLAADTHTFTVGVQSAGQTSSRALSISVTPVPVASVVITPSSADMAVGDTLVLSVTARDASGAVLQGRSAAWTSSHETVATVSSQGAVVAVGVGAATVVATVEGFPAWASISVRDLLNITDSTLAEGVKGRPYADTLRVRGGDGDYTWAVVQDSLPAGSTLNDSTGVVAGTPTAAGTESFTVRVASGDGQADSVRVSVIIREALEVSSTALSSGGVGSAYADTVRATGGRPPYLWTLSAGSLPAGLTLNTSTGRISGTPSAAGSSSFTVRVGSDDHQSATKALSIAVALQPVASVVVTPAVAGATRGLTLQLTATPKDAGGNALTGRTITWISGDTGVATVNSGGVVTGVAVGTTTITATAEGVPGSAILTVHAPLGVTTASLAGGSSGVPYNQALAAAGGDGTYIWTLTAGALPAGLALDGDTGVISGTPAGPGVSGFTVQVVSGGGQVATKALAITIS